MTLFRSYSPDKYPKYDNYEAVNVDRTVDIPCDYYGVMGVPITFLSQYNPEQFEIVAFRKGNDGKDLVYSFTDNSQTVHVERGGARCSRTSEFSFATSIPGMIKNTEGKICGKITYARITIRRKRSQNI